MKINVPSSSLKRKYMHLLRTINCQLPKSRMYTQQHRTYTNSLSGHLIDTSVDISSLHL